MPPDAVVLAVCAAFEAGCQVALKAMEGQTPDQRAKIWEWYIQDVTLWRRFWGLEKTPEKTP